MFVNGGENLVNEEKGLSIQGRVIQGWQGKSRYQKSLGASKPTLKDH
jgi:hypothetical protein